MPLAEEIARVLQAAERPAVVAGTSCGSKSLIEAAANVAWALCKKGRSAALSLVVPECNSLGLAMTAGNGSLQDAVHAEPDTVIVLENDLYRHISRATIDALFGAAKHVIAIDHTINATTEKADVVLPSATFAESTGTLVNNEGRAQRFYTVFVPQGEMKEGWRWLQELMILAGRPLASQKVPVWENVDAIDDALACAIPIFRPIIEIAPPAGFRIVGEKIAREPHRYSGRTAMHANVSVHEPKPPNDPDSPLAFTMEGYPGELPPALIPHYWAPGWNSVQALNKFQEEVAGPLRGGDPGKRLGEPAQGKPWAYFETAPPAFAPHEREWLLVPIYHIFGSEELSVLAPGIAELMPKPYLGLNSRDAEQLRVTEGQEILVGNARLPVKLMPSLPGGVAGVPIGLPGMLAVETHIRVKLGGAT
jgi:NADH-quinone oxidoreductase subunit G